jgi:serine/threonine protein phosphatase 1
MRYFKSFLGNSRTGTQPDVPEGLRIYAIGDVHGRMDLLQLLNEMIRHDLESRPVRESIEIFLGDYTDRGADSRAVIDYLASDQRVCDRRICLKGNHDEIFLTFLEDPSVLVEWRDLGGLETLYSYGVSPPISRDPKQAAECQARLLEIIPESHVAFLQNLCLKAEFGSYFFVHAGIDPNKDIERQDENDLLWIRDPFLSCRSDFGVIVVHGHTPQSQYEHLPNRINVDTGAALSGRLTCAVLEANSVRFLQTKR